MNYYYRKILLCRLVYKCKIKNLCFRKPKSFTFVNRNGLKN